MTQKRTLQTQVAWACRILAMNGHEDFTLGHVSARDDDGIVHIKRNGLGLREVTPDDIVSIDLERRRLAGSGKLHLETILHTEVYRARSDVAAVIHTHPPYTIALGASDASLEYLNHDAVLFEDGISTYKKGAELITEPEQGQAIADALGTRRVLLLRNHGVLVVGKAVPWAVYTALTLERAVQIQAIASTLGDLRPMSDEMVTRLYPNKYRDEFVDAYWQYLIRQARRQALGDNMPTDTGNELGEQ